jgi:hypothetical protein
MSFWGMRTVVGEIIFVGGPYDGLRGNETAESDGTEIVRGLHGEHIYVRFHSAGGVNFYRHAMLTFREALKLLPRLPPQ